MKKEDDSPAIESAEDFVRKLDADADITGMIELRDAAIRRAALIAKAEAGRGDSDGG